MPDYLITLDDNDPELDGMAEFVTAADPEAALKALRRDYDHLRPNGSTNGFAWGDPGEDDPDAVDTDRIDAEVFLVYPPDPGNPVRRQAYLGFGHVGTATVSFVPDPALTQDSPR